MGRVAGAAQCIGDNREIFQYIYGYGQPWGGDQQKPAPTQQGIYNNREGRLCAGCRGDNADTNPKHHVYPHPSITAWKDRQSIIDCCVDKLKKGSACDRHHCAKSGY